MTEWCYCCFIEIDTETAHPGEASYQMPGGFTMRTQVYVCTACRRLGCEILNPDGCKRPETFTLPEGVAPQAPSP